MNFFEARGFDMRVDLSGGDARVAQHLLHVPHIDSARQQVRGKAVPQGVRADIDRDPGPLRVLLD